MRRLPDACAQRRAPVGCGPLPDWRSAYAQPHPPAYQPRPVPAKALVILLALLIVGAGLVVNSLTKSIGGQGDALGGAITDTGLYDWSGYPNIFAAYRKGDAKGWGLQQLRKKGLREH